MRHRGIGTSPRKVLNSENWNEVRKHTEKYIKEFETKQSPVFTVGQIVLIKNENKQNKMDDEYKEMGEIIQCLDHHVCNLKMGDSKVFLRHSSHLRLWPGDVDQKHPISIKKISDKRDM